MPRAKKGTVTGDNLTQSKRGRKGGLTGSKHFDKPEVETPTSPVETTRNTVGKVASAVGKGVKAAANTVGAARDIAQTVSNGARQVRRSTNGGSDLVTADIKETLSKADDLASEYGLESTDLKSAMRTDSYGVDESIPEMTAKEANVLKLRIQRQNNALDVRLERTKQKRKIATVATEEIRLVGDLVDYSTAGIETATKVVKNQIADTKYQTEQSKLEETEELLEQQIIRTQGTIALTQGVRDEWNLKLEKQERNNEQIRLEIAGADAKNNRKREEIESFIFDD
ncbi:MAG: hypothetical protein HC836_34385 [Richelia sp. RM2_1_2]|nr:hypothetical protein [Richelia sp. SM1_7_0]NJO30424.1 hypothetical protein [Richelia sp. SL_2_1]NJO63125.1 hypothetical protein [Richelia sp. RM2_1_2]